MSYKDILVYLDPTPASEQRLGVAVDLAKTHGSRLIGLDASTDAAFEGAWEMAATKIGDGFETAVRDAGLSGKFLVGRPDGLPVSGETYCVDLVVAPSPTPETRGLIDAAVPDQALMHAGAPVLIIPQEWRGGPLGQRVVIAWNASREANRAVHDALPLLKRAENVVVFAFSAHSSGLRASADHLIEHLARHGVTAQVSDWTDTGDITAVEALFASVDTQDADMFVTGAFGHSRVFESLFGGVSRELLKEPMLPLLMSH